MDYLRHIIARKEVEVHRRRAHQRWLDAMLSGAPEARGAVAVERLRRDGNLPRVIAEVKFRSPSAGAIHPRAPGEVARVARAYQSGGAAAVSVLADGPGFAGSVLDVRRASRAVSVPVLFKEFVIDPVQVRFARAAGAALVLLLVRVLDDVRLRALIATVRREGMEPVVEAADASEVERALRTEATVVGVNARDLRTFRVDTAEAARCLARVPQDRVAVFMSGIRSGDDVAWAARTRADALLVGEGLMRAQDPAATLRGWLGAP
jgi:indole-3-glycerol phosphate synthase